MSIFAANFIDAFTPVRCVALSTASRVGHLLLPLLFLVLTAFLNAFIKSAKFLNAAGEDDAERPGVPASLAQKLQTAEKRDVFFREVKTAVFLSTASYFIVGTYPALPSFLALTGTADAPADGWMTFLWSVVLLFLMAVVGFALPLRAGGRQRDAFAGNVWPAVSFLLFFVRPVERLFRMTSGGFMKLCHLGDVRGREQVLTEDEILSMLSHDDGEGASDAHNVEYIENLFQFDDKVASDIMTHRIEMDALPIDTDYETTLSFIKTSRHTRYPIYSGTIDNVVGILLVKDLIFAERDDHFSLEKAMREPSFTPESRNTRQLLREMQKNHIQMTIVIDEYGGTAGLITMVDLVEQIVGDIDDEYDDDAPEITRVGPNEWIVEGSYPINLLARETGVSFGEDEFDTTAGFLIEQLDRIPEEHEHPSVTYRSLTFDVLSMEDNRIAWIRVTRKEPEEAQPSEEDDTKEPHD